MLSIPVLLNLLAFESLGSELERIVFAYFNTQRLTIPTRGALFISILLKELLETTPRLAIQSTPNGLATRTHRKIHSHIPNPQHYR